jgi:alpha/beta hydrolase family protein
MHSRKRKRVCWIGATLIAMCGGAYSAMPAQRRERALLGARRNIASAKQVRETSADNAGPQRQSRITGISVSGSRSAGTFGGVPYTRTWGAVTGVVAPGENVHGLAALPRDPDGNYEYKSEFEIIAPAKPGVNSVIVVEAENRGSPVFLNSLQGIKVAGPPSAGTYEPGLGNGFLFEHATSYARVQWQTGIAAGVPKQAEGVGEVILRDFARLLAGRTRIETNPQFDPGAYHTLILSGISLSGFFINTFIAEGFNADPLGNRAVFDGAIAVDGTGNWLALNQLAAASGSEEYAYLVPNGKPLDAAALLTRPQSDPYYIDIANYTDFYRLRASLTDHSALPARMRRYDWPSPHAAAPIDQNAGSARAGRCNGGVVVDLNPISYAPYLRAVTLELERALGVKSASNAPPLPPTTLFKLGPAPASAANFNPLPGVTLEVPATDADDQPVGGVRFPEVDHPIGRPTPVSLPPVVTTSIDGTCGNLGEWQQFTTAQLTERYGSSPNYLSLYAASLDKLIAEGYILASDRAQMLKTAASLYARSANH